MNNNVLEINADKREESINLDLNASTYSELNMKNMSFYSYNDQGNEYNKYNNPSDFIKYKSEKRMDMDAFKMLPYYIEKVSKNIQYLDDLIKKQKIDPDSSALLNNSQAIPTIENLNNLITKSVNSVNEVLANNKKAIETIGKKKLNLSKSGNRSLDAKTLMKISKTGKKFDVIDEKDEDIMSKKDTNLNTKGLSLKNARINKKSLASMQGGTPSMKKFSVTSSKGVMNKGNSENTNSSYNTNKSLQSNYKTANTSATGNSLARPKTATTTNKPSLSVRPDNINSGKDMSKNYQTLNTISNKDPSQLKKNINSSILNAQIKSANISVKKKPATLADQRQNSMTNLRKDKENATLEKVNPRRVFSPSPIQSEPNKLMANLTYQKTTSKSNLALVKPNLNQSSASNNLSINLGNKLINKCNCVCTCNNGLKNTSISNLQASNVNNNTTAVTELNSRLLTTTIPQLNISEYQADLKGQLKKLCEMYLISHEYNLIKKNQINEKEAKLSNFLKNSLKSIDEEAEPNSNKNFSYVSLSANYNSNNSNSGVVAPSDRRKELNKRRDEIKALRIVQIQRKWREYLMKKTFGIKNFSLKSSVKSEVIKSTKEKFYNMLTSVEKLEEMVQLTNRANLLWNEINENSNHLSNDFGYDNMPQNPSSFNNFYYNSLSKMLTDHYKLTKELNVVK